MISKGGMYLIRYSVLQLMRGIFGPHLGYPLVFLPFFILYRIWSLGGSKSSPSLYEKHDGSLASSAIQGSNLTAENESFLVAYSLQNLPYFIIVTELVLGLGLIGISAFFHYTFYVNKDTSNTWKLQPNKFMTRELRRRGLIEGLHGLVHAALVIGAWLCYVYNGGPASKVYYNLRDYPLWWAVLQYPVLLFWEDFQHYWFHRFYHLPGPYKWVHKSHHKYKQPEVYTIQAGNPIEWNHFQLITLTPMFIAPFHWITLLVYFTHLFIMTLINHSGVAIKAQWWLPWEPDNIFHDTHHSSGHINFGLHSYLWDKLFGTCGIVRIKDRSLKSADAVK